MTLHESVRRKMPHAEADALHGLSGTEQAAHLSFRFGADEQDEQEGKQTYGHWDLIRAAEEDGDTSCFFLPANVAMAPATAISMLLDVLHTSTHAKQEVKPEACKREPLHDLGLLHVVDSDEEVDSHNTGVAVKAEPVASVASAPIPTNAVHVVDSDEEDVPQDMGMALLQEEPACRGMSPDPGVLVQEEPNPPAPSQHCDAMVAEDPAAPESAVAHGGIEGTTALVGHVVIWPENLGATHGRYPQARTHRLGHQKLCPWQRGAGGFHR